MQINSPALYRLSYRGIYSVVLARNLPLGCHLYGLTPCSLGRIYKAVNPNSLALYCSKEMGLFASPAKNFIHPANPHESKLFCGSGLLSCMAVSL